MSGSSASPNDYGALADELDTISNITSNSVNAEILRKLKTDDPEFTALSVDAVHDDNVPRGPDYVIEDARGMEVLGYYLGRSTHVTTLIVSFPEGLTNDVIGAFLSAALGEALAKKSVTGNEKKYSGSGQRKITVFVNRHSPERKKIKDTRRWWIRRTGGCKARRCQPTLLK